MDADRKVASYLPMEGYIESLGTRLRGYLEVVEDTVVLVEGNGIGRAGKVGVQGHVQSERGEAGTGGWREGGG